MKTTFKICLLTMAAVAIQACSPIKTTTSYTETTDFSTYDSFAFFKPNIENLSPDTQEDMNAIISALSSELEARGYETSEEPDLLVSILLTSKDRNVAYNRGWGAHTEGWSSSPEHYKKHLRTEQQESLYISLFDAKTKKMVWQGVGSRTIAHGSKRSTATKVVDKLIETFPIALGN